MEPNFIEEPCVQNPTLMDKFIIGKDGFKNLVFCANKQEWYDFE